MSAKQALDAVAAIAANTDLSAEASAAFALGHVAGQAEQAAAAPKSKPLLIYWGGIAARASYSRKRTPQCSSLDTPSLPMESM